MFDHGGSVTEVWSFKLELWSLFHSRMKKYIMNVFSQPFIYNKYGFIAEARVSSQIYICIRHASENQRTCSTCFS